MLRTLSAAAVVLLASLAACGPGGASRQAGPQATATATPDPARPLPSPLPELVARVNGSAITLRQVLPLAKAALDRESVAEREARLPVLLRQAVQRYIDRELLLQEALTRGIQADEPGLQRAYDQARREHGDEAGWIAFLAKQGMDAQSFKQELRIQHTVAALIEREREGAPIPESEVRQLFEANERRFGPPDRPASFEAVRGELEAYLRRTRGQELVAELVARLRAKARIELLL